MRPGMTPQQLALIKQQNIYQKRRLERILESRQPNNYGFSKSFMDILESKRHNHEKIRQSHEKYIQTNVQIENMRMYNRIMKISLSSSPYSQTRTRSNTLLDNGNRKLGNSDETAGVESQIKKVTTPVAKPKYLHHYPLVQKMKEIQRQNLIIGERIMRRTSYLDHIKDEIEFRKTREILHRLQRFPSYKDNDTPTHSRTDSSENKTRSRTLPMRKSFPAVLSGGVQRIGKTNIDESLASKLSQQKGFQVRNRPNFPSKDPSARFFSENLQNNDDMEQQWGFRKTVEVRHRADSINNSYKGMQQKPKTSMQNVQEQPEPMQTFLKEENI